MLSGLLIVTWISVQSFTCEFKCLVLLFFFFQAEDGIRDLVRSRGLGDVYKRQDPGGWYMIDPPKGSFSWIPERFVKRINDTEGEVLSLIHI